MLKEDIRWGVYGLVAGIILVNVFMLFLEGGGTVAFINSIFTGLFGLKNFYAAITFFFVVLFAIGVAVGRLLQWVRS